MNKTMISISGLLQLVPRAPGSAIPSGATTSEIDALEVLLGFEIPVDLREWLLLSNGPCVGPGGLFGVGAAPKHLLIASHLGLHPEWATKKWVPVAGDGCGNYYVLVTSQEFGPGFPVIFVEPLTDATVPVYLVASSIWKFLEFLLKKEITKSSWPFDRDEVLAQDPGVFAFSGIHLPWDD